MGLARKSKVVDGENFGEVFEKPRPVSVAQPGFFSLAGFATLTIRKIRSQSEVTRRSRSIRFYTDRNIRKYVKKCDNEQGGPHDNEQGGPHPISHSTQTWA